jgi:regulatory protein
MTCPPRTSTRKLALQRKDQHDPAPERAGSDAQDAPDAGVDTQSTESGRGIALAYAFLNKRERTEAEVRARLERAEVPGDEIDSVLAELLEFGYLDDARYARVFTQDKRTLEAWGNERIARTLRERGVERDLIEAALAEGGGQDRDEGAGDAGSELDRAVALLGQRFPGGPGEPRDRERAFGVLARKGYESETASDAVREWARRAAA